MKAALAVVLGLLAVACHSRGTSRAERLEALKALAALPYERCLRANTADPDGELICGAIQAAKDGDRAKARGLGLLVQQNRAMRRAVANSASYGETLQALAIINTLTTPATGPPSSTTCIPFGDGIHCSSFP